MSHRPFGFATIILAIFLLQPLCADHPLNQRTLKYSSSPPPHVCLRCTTLAYAENVGSQFLSLCQQAFNALLSSGAKDDCHFLLRRHLIFSTEKVGRFLPACCPHAAMEAGEIAIDRSNSEHAGLALVL